MQIMNLKMKNKASVKLSNICYNKSREKKETTFWNNEKNAGGKIWREKEEKSTRELKNPHNVNTRKCSKGSVVKGTKGP